MKKSIKRTIATGAVATALVLGGAGVVAATTGAALPGMTHAATSSTPTPGDSNDSHEQESSIVGSIAAPAEANEAAEDTETAADETAREAAETKALEALATITPDQATTAALKAVPGTVGTVQLEEEDGFVVYKVEVTAADGTVTEVIVDAGNGTVLAQEVEGADDANEAPDTNDTTETPEVGGVSETPAQ